MVVIRKMVALFVDVMVLVFVGLSIEKIWVYYTRFSRSGSLKLFDGSRKRKRFAESYLYVIVFTIEFNRVLISL